MNQPLRYLLMATHVPASGSGAGMVRYTVELAAALARRDDVELHVLVTTNGADFFGRSLRSEQIHPVIGLPTAPRSLLERRGGRALIRPWQRFDVVHGTKHLLPRRVDAAKRLLTVHDMLPMDRPSDFGRAKRLLLRRPYFTSIREADRIVCVSQATRARLLDYVPNAAERTTVVPLGVSGALQRAVVEPVAQLLGRPFAIVVGDSSARKNLELAVETWPQVRETVPNAVLAVVGRPAWHTSHVGRTWDELVADGAVLPLGGISDGALRWCYENTAAVLCPSMLEGFGLPSLEGAAFGANVITSEDPALCEASGGFAVHVPAWHRPAWTAAVVQAFQRPRSAGPGPQRGWDDVAADTLDAVRLYPTGV